LNSVKNEAQAHNPHVYWPAAHADCLRRSRVPTDGRPSAQAAVHVKLLRHSLPADNRLDSDHSKAIKHCVSFVIEYYFNVKACILDETTFYACLWSY